MMGNIVDLKEYRLKKKNSEPSTKHFVWIKDIIRLEPEKAPRIGRYEWCDFVQETFYPTDPKYHELHTQAGFAENELIPCLFGVKMGNSNGGNWTQPFISYEEALEWIDSLIESFHSHEENLYFVTSTNPRLREKFPGVPVRA